MNIFTIEATYIVSVQETIRLVDYNKIIIMSLYNKALFVSYTIIALSMIVIYSVVSSQLSIVYC